MDIITMDQGLLKRNPALTPEEFYTHWLTKHAPLVVPFFLHSGVRHYQQIHGPLLLTNPTSLPVPLSLNISSYSGAVALPPQSTLSNPAPMPKWKQAYYEEIILADERRFLVTEALQHIVRVPPGSVTGETKVVIRDGECVIEVGEGVWRVWKGYEARGEGEEEEAEVQGQRK